MLNSKRHETFSAVWWFELRLLQWFSGCNCPSSKQQYILCAFVYLIPHWVSHCSWETKLLKMIFDKTNLYLICCSKHSFWIPWANLPSFLPQQWYFWRSNASTIILFSLCVWVYVCFFQVIWIISHTVSWNNGNCTRCSRSSARPQQEVLQVLKFIAEIQSLLQSWTVYHSDCHKSMQSSSLVKLI